eukprot:g6045.t1
MAADPLADLEGKLDGLSSDADIMDRFSRILIDETPALLRTLFRNLWQHRYGAPWVDGAECGDELMFGPADFSHGFGSVSVKNNSTRIQCGLDLRFQYQGDLTGAGIAPAAWPQGLWPGCRVRLGGAAGSDAGGRLLWLKPSPGAGSKIKFKNGVSTFNLSERWDGATAAATPLWGRTRAFYDRQTGGNSAAKGAAAQRKLRAGIPGEWDLTVLLWILLNSAHDGKPNPADEAEGMLFGLGAEAASLVAGLNDLRFLRNEKHGHTGAWSMTAPEFAAAVNRIRGTMARADTLAAALGWANWPGLEAEFNEIVAGVVDEKVTEADRLRYVEALRERPVLIPFPRNKQFTGRADLLEDLEAVFFPGHAAADGGDDDGSDGDDGGYAPAAGGAAGGAAAPDPPPLPPPPQHHHHVITQGSLKGMGGVGKTGLAVEYAWRAVHDLGLYPGGVLTLRAESLQSLADSLRDVALKHLAIDDKQRKQWDDEIRKDPAAALDTAWWYVRRWLEANDELWLLLVDNADDRDLLLGTKMWKELQTLQAAVAAGGSGGHVLVTSRAQEWPGLRPIDVSTVSEEDAALMIVRYYQTLDNDAAATAFIGGLAAEESAALNEIVKLLDGLPLALEFAGTYMRSVNCDFAEYLRCFNEEDQIEFMGRKEGRAESILQDAAGGAAWGDVLKKVGLDGEELGYEAKLAAAGI